MQFQNVCHDSILYTKKSSVAQIHWELFLVYGSTVISEGKVKECYQNWLHKCA